MGFKILTSLVFDVVLNIATLAPRNKDVQILNKSRLRSHSQINIFNRAIQILPRDLDIEHILGSKFEFLQSCEFFLTTAVVQFTFILAPPLYLSGNVYVKGVFYQTPEITHSFTIFLFWDTQV